MSRKSCPMCARPLTSKIDPKEGFASLLCKNCGCLVIYGTFTRLDEITHYKFIPKEDYDKGYKLKEMILTNPFISLKTGDNGK